MSRSGYQPDVTTDSSHAAAAETLLEDLAFAGGSRSCRVAGTLLILTPHDSEAEKPNLKPHEGNR
jgi:hypothetical protein